MKTQKFNKLVSVTIVFLMAFSQVMPVGSATQPFRPEEDATGVSKDGLSVPMKEVKKDGGESAEKTAKRISEYEDFFMVSPLKSAVKDPRELLGKKPFPLNGEKPRPVIEKPVIKIKEIKVITDPASGKELTVSIDKRGIATVRWGDQEYKGFFDKRTNSIVLVTDQDGIWTLQFGKEKKGGLYLQSFKTEQSNDLSYSEETYTFDQKGQLVRKEWETSFNNRGWELYACPTWGCAPQMSASGGTIDYVHINGKTLVSHEKTWSENSGPIWYEYEVYKVGVEGEKYPFLKPYPSNRSVTDTFYSYDGEGNLIAKSWVTQNGYSFSHGLEIYVHINGRDLISERRVWTYGGKPYIYPVKPVKPVPIEYDPFLDKKILYDQVKVIDDKMFVPPYYGGPSYAASFFQYDAQGNMTGELNVWENTNWNGERNSGASYWVFDADSKTWSTAFANNLNIWAIRSLKDRVLIDQAATTKFVYVGATVENRWAYTHWIAYNKDANGEFQAQVVFDLKGNAFIVQGKPDVLSGENNDIRIKQWQSVNGYTVSYQEYWHSNEQGQWVNDGYRLVFYGSPLTGPNTIAVDFPNVDTVTFDNKEYRIIVDETGVLHLRILRATLADGTIQEFYDEDGYMSGQIRKVIYPDGLIQHYGYFVQIQAGRIDINRVLSRQELTKDGLHYEWRFVYGAGAGVTETVTDPNGIVIKTTFFDYVNFLATVTENGKVTKYQFEILDHDPQAGRTVLAKWPEFLLDGTRVERFIVGTLLPPTVPVPTDITITVPTSLGGITVKGKVPALEGPLQYWIWFSVNGGPYVYLNSADSSGNWYGFITLSPGSNTISIVVKQWVNASTYLTSEPVVLEPMTYIPPAVQSYMDALQKAIGDGFAVTAESDALGKFIIHVKDMKNYALEPAAGLHEMSFVLFQEVVGKTANLPGNPERPIYGAPKIDPASLTAFYYGKEGDLKPDAQLLFEALHQLPQIPEAQDVRAFVNMSKLSVIGIDEDKTVHVVLDGQHYKAYHNADGKAVLETELPSAVQAVQKAVQLGLVNTFGFSKATLDQLIKDGKITIKVDLDNLTAAVTIDPSVTVPVSVVNFIDPLGLTKLPEGISLQLGKTMKYGYEDPFYYLVSGVFQAGQYSYEMDYEIRMVFEGPVCYPGKACPKVMFRYAMGTNRLASVRMYDEKPGYVCVKEPCHELMETIQYAYSQYGKTEAVEGEPLSVTISIVYAHPANDVAGREITLVAMEDSQYRIQTVTDKDVAGNGIAKSQFNYQYFTTNRECPPEEPDCNTVGVVLESITRTDANGKPLSEILEISSNQALVVISGPGTKVEFGSWEELLDIARKLEQNPFPDVPQVLLNAIAERLGINVRDLVNIHLIKREMECKAYGYCPQSYFIDLIAVVNGEKKHFVGAATVGTWQPELVATEIYRPDSPPNELPVPKQPTEVSLFLIETGLEVEAVVAITQAIGIQMESLTGVEFEDRSPRVVCKGTGCTMWSGLFRIKTNDGRYFEGTITKIFGVPEEESYRIEFKEIRPIEQLRDEVIAEGNSVIALADAILSKIDEFYALAGRINGAVEEAKRLCAGMRSLIEASGSYDPMVWDLLRKAEEISGRLVPQDVPDFGPLSDRAMQIKDKASHMIMEAEMAFEKGDIDHFKYLLDEAHVLSSEAAQLDSMAEGEILPFREAASQTVMQYEEFVAEINRLFDEVRMILEVVIIIEPPDFPPIEPPYYGPGYNFGAEGEEGSGLESNVEEYAVEAALFPSIEELAGEDAGVTSESAPASSGEAFSVMSAVQLMKISQEDGAIAEGSSSAGSGDKLLTEVLGSQLT